MTNAQTDQSVGCQCPACEKTSHTSDCAVHNAPAFPVGECDCGAQREPEFFTHNVEQPYVWSEWVCPDPKGYLMKCCDCGLVHEAEFAVVRYKSETERDDCDMVNDPNLQAVFRMRRSEQWSPKDTAYRPGGLVQPEQEPVAWRNAALRVGEDLCSVGPFGYYEMTAEQWLDWALSVVTVHAPPQRKPLTDEEIESINVRLAGSRDLARLFARAIEAAHGIKE